MLPGLFYLLRLLLLKTSCNLDDMGVWVTLARNYPDENDDDDDVEYDDVYIMMVRILKIRLAIWNLRERKTDIAILHFGRSCHIFQGVLCGQNNSAYQLSTEKVHTLKDMVSTNVYSEGFFCIKKHISFSGKPRYTIDPFFEDNYKDYASILKKVMVDTLIFDGNFFSYVQIA